MNALLPPAIIPMLDGALQPGAACPCCGVPLPLGLFARVAAITLPAAVRMMRETHRNLEAVQDDSYIIIADRCFIRVDATLPLDWDDSPVRISTWVEVEGRQLPRISNVFEDGQRSIRLSGTLANDIPGLAGTIGARATVEVDGVSGTMRLTQCADQRAASSRGRPTHDQLVALYRRVWGRSVALDDPDHVLRGQALDMWNALAGSDLFLTPIEPPPFIAGIEPASLGVKPPRDTGDVAMMVTVGNCDTGRPGAERTEVVCWMHDPSEEFRGSFADFAYWSRIAKNPLAAGSIISETGGIPGTANSQFDIPAKTGWLLCNPFWDGAPDLEERTVGSVVLRPLAAVPITSEENQLARASGPGELVSRLVESGVPLFDAERPSCV